MAETQQRTWVPIIARAIRRYAAERGDDYREGDYAEIDGYTVLVSREPGTPAGNYNIGLYEPTSPPWGTCDWYGVCTHDGEEAEA